MICPLVMTRLAGKQPEHLVIGHDPVLDDESVADHEGSTPTHSQGPASPVPLPRHRMNAVSAAYAHSSSSVNTPWMHCLLVGKGLQVRFAT
jgi:hypothetical protein